ncbi:MAG: FUSC family protein [Desulfovibrio sp.]|nr:FUSC family protein [Desulfovibrio sp.]
MPISSQNRNFMIRGVLYMLGMCIPITISQIWNKPDVALLGALGALFALFIAPRYTPLPRVLCIGTGGLLVCLAASVGVLTQGNNDLALIPLVLFSWLAALPRPEQAYLSLVFKNMGAAALLTHFGMVSSLISAELFMAGLAFGALLSVLGIQFGSGQGVGASPFEEFAAFKSGTTNDRLFGMAVPLTVLICTLAARGLAFSHPAWVGLTVLFVMHSNGATELRRIRDRALGTVLGVIAMGPVIFSITNPLPLAIFIGLAALFIPYAQAGHYMLFSFVITVIVLLLIDLAMLNAGGDISLLRWRLLDTLLACGGVLISNLILRLIERKQTHN